MDAFPIVLFVVFGLVVVGGFWLRHHAHQRLVTSHQALVDREPGLRATDTPCGFAASSLLRFAGIDRGDRRFGVRWGVEGPLGVRIAGRESGVNAAAFEWWCERRHRNKHGTSYTTRTVPVVLAELPVELPVDVTLGPESLLGRAGLTRADQQVESTAFNRAFRVRSSDERLTLQLLDANLQTVLPRDFDGRTITISGRYVVMTGRPRHRDAQLDGVIGQLPAVRQDLQHLLAEVPAQFWRAVGADPHAGGHP
ncbi:hypothetical protein FTX61_09210 [Nitriliruptoraceae bacterium ZYF776]|nr:hypothetical protein [Profundirhabdus halotolerans]